MGILKTNHVLQQRDDELTEFQCWIFERKSWDEQLNLIRQEEWDRFLNSKDKDKELDIICIEPSDFYNEFEELLGIYDFDKSFVHMNYIDELKNSINLIVNVNGVNQRFRVDVV
jgi:hypothetical protein